MSSHATYASTLLPVLLSHGVPAARGHIHLPGWASYLQLPESIEVVEIGLPLGADNFGVHKWLQVGRALRGERGESVVLAVGIGRPRKVSRARACERLPDNHGCLLTPLGYSLQAPASYAQSVVDGLAHHTSAPREEWITQMFAPPGAASDGAFVPVDPRMGAFLAAVGAGGELEGHPVPGIGWRFGDVPM